MTNITNLSSKTNYNRIFKNTYWGGFEYTDPHYDNIIENRNKFVIDYNLRKICNTRRTQTFYYVFKKYVKLDHVEFYTTDDPDMILVLNSPYCVTEEQDQKLVEHGFKKIYPLYNNLAQSYVKIMLK